MLFVRASSSFALSEAILREYSLLRKEEQSEETEADSRRGSGTYFMVCFL
jgi:hypothetical protein